MNHRSHLAYDRERQADLVREARRRELTSAIGRSRDDERRSFLARAWARRHALRAPAPSAG